MMFLLIPVLNRTSRLLLNSISKMMRILTTLLLGIIKLVFSLILLTLLLVNLNLVISLFLLIIMSHKLSLLMLNNLLINFLRISVNGLIIRLLSYYNSWKRRKIEMKQLDWVSFRNQVLSPILLQAGILFLQDRLSRLSQPDQPPRNPSPENDGVK